MATLNLRTLADNLQTYFQRGQMVADCSQYIEIPVRTMLVRLKVVYQRLKGLFFIPPSVPFKVWSNSIKRETKQSFELGCQFYLANASMEHQTPDYWYQCWKQLSLEDKARWEKRAKTFLEACASPTSSLVTTIGAK